MSFNVGDTDLFKNIDYATSNNPLDDFFNSDIFIDPPNSPNSTLEKTSVATNDIFQIQPTEEFTKDTTFDLVKHNMTDETNMHDQNYKRSSSINNPNTMNRTIESFGSNSSSSTTVNSKKRKMQSAVLDTLEDRSPKRSKLEMSFNPSPDASMIFNPAPDASMIFNPAPNAGMIFNPAPNASMIFNPASSSSSSSSLSDMRPLDKDGWCSFDPEISGTRILEKIKNGELNVSKHFPNNNFKVTDNEWELIKNYLPNSLQKRELINNCIVNLMHESILSHHNGSSTDILHEKKKKNFSFGFKLNSFKSDEIYEVKLVICKYLVRFRGFLSTKYKTNEHASKNNIKLSFRTDLEEKIKNHFQRCSWKAIKKSLLKDFDNERALTMLHIKSFFYIGVGGSVTGIKVQYFTANQCKDIRQHIIEDLQDIVLNTNIVSCLNDYIHEKCSELKKYWMPHLL